MVDDRRFVSGMHYTRRGRNSPPKEGEPEIQFGLVGSPGGSGSIGLRPVDAEVDRGALHAFRNIIAGQQHMIGVLQ